MTHMLTIGLLTVVAAFADDSPLFKIRTKRDNDRVEVKAEKEKVVFTVHSPFGISNAVVERAGESWPDAVMLRLHLKGLETFQATNDKVTLEASVSSQDGKMRLWMDGKEDSPLDAQSLYWMRIRMVGTDGRPAKDVPLTDGYIEIPLPKAFFEENPKSITIRWVDFYRD